MNLVNEITLFWSFCLLQMVKVYDGLIKDLGFNFHLYQKLNSILV